MGNRSSRQNGRRTPAARNVRRTPATRNVRHLKSAPAACKKTMFVYPTCDWDEKHIVRMESQKLIGPREEPLSSLEEIAGTRECGICFNTFKNVLNQLTCCKYEICTECYLQLKAPPQNLAKANFIRPENPPLCPYCRTTEFEVIYSLGNAASTNVTMKHTKVKKTEASKTRPKADSAPRTNTRRDNSAEFVIHNDIPDSLEEIEQMMLAAALANSSREHEEHTAAAAAATTASAHASAATVATDDASTAATIPRMPTVSHSTASDLAPRSPPMVPLSSRRRCATTPELSIETPKRTNLNAQTEEMLPLTI